MTLIIVLHLLSCVSTIFSRNFVLYEGFVVFRTKNVWLPKGSVSYLCFLFQNELRFFIHCLEFCLIDADI